MQAQNEKERQNHISELSKYQADFRNLAQQLEEANHKERRLRHDLERVRQERDSLESEVDELRETVELRNSQLLENAQNDSAIMVPNNCKQRYCQCSKLRRVFNSYYSPHMWSLYLCVVS